MKPEQLQYIIREELISAITEEDIQTSPFTPAEEKFLARFAELGSQSLGIIYTPNMIGVREFLGRSGKDFNLTPDVLARLLRDKIISLIPYGGYARNTDYTLRCNLPLEDLEGMASGQDEEGKESDTGGEVAAGPPEESAGSSKDLSKLLVSEAKKSKKKVHRKKARTLGRLPSGFVVYLEKIITILAGKLHTTHEKEHLVADILDNLAYNFGLTPKEIYRAFIFYKSQNRLQNVIKEQTEPSNKPQVFKKEPFDQSFAPNYIQPNEEWKTELTPILKEMKALMAKGWRLDQLQVEIQSGASEDRATNRYSGENPPDHNFQTVGVQKGGLLPDWGWVPTVDEDGNETKRGPNGWLPNNGNPFLAKQRAEIIRPLIKDYLETELRGKLSDDAVFINRADTGVREVIVSLKSILKKKPIKPVPTPLLVQITGEMPGYESSRYQWWDESGHHGRLIPSSYRQIKKLMHKTPEQGGYSPGDAYYKIKELVDFPFDAWQKNRKDPRYYKKLKPTTPSPV